MAFPAWLPISVFLHLIVIICSLLLLPSTMLEDWVISHPSDKATAEMSVPPLPAKPRGPNVLVTSTVVYKVICRHVYKGVCVPERDDEGVDAVFAVFQQSGLLCCYLLLVFEVELSVLWTWWEAGSRCVHYSKPQWGWPHCYNKVAWETVWHWLLPPTHLPCHTLCALFSLALAGAFSNKALLGFTN